MMRIGLPLALMMMGLGLVRTAEGKPNVLMIAVDDLNHWVGHLGRNGQTITPNIDRLAKRGVSFANAYCAAPACNPSRAALMSGMRPSTSGVYHNPDDWRPGAPVEMTLTSAFRKAGYFTAGAGKIYHGGLDRRGEWDEYFRGGGGDARPAGGSDGVGGIKFAPVDVADEQMGDYRIVEYGIEQLQKKQSKSFFLTIGLHKPHMPWNVPRKYYEMHPLEKIELPPHRADDLSDVPAAGVRVAGPEGDHARILESGRWKEAVQGYLAAVTFGDAMIGRLLDALEKSEHRENTIVVLWGDHGWHLGEKSHWRKFALWEEATRSPLVFVVPGVTKEGAVCRRTVDFMGIYPTLCELAGMEIPKHVEGVSFKALLSDPEGKWERPALTTHGYKNHAVRTEKWRYIRYLDGSEELYDEVGDPYEWVNLAGKGEYAEVKAKLGEAMPTVEKRPSGDETAAPRARARGRGIQD